MNNGVKFIVRNPIESFEGSEEKVKTVKFANGLNIDTDLVVLFPNNVIANN